MSAAVRLAVGRPVQEACGWLQEQVQHVVSISMKLLLLMYYEVLEDACRMLMELVKARSVLLQPYMQPLVDCLLDVYNALPVEQQPSLMKHVERLMDYMAQHMDVHALMEVRSARPRLRVGACVLRSLRVA